MQDDPSAAEKSRVSSLQVRALRLALGGSAQGQVGAELCNQVGAQRGVLASRLLSFHDSLRLQAALELCAKNQGKSTPRASPVRSREGAAVTSPLVTSVAGSSSHAQNIVDAGVIDLLRSQVRLS